MQLWEYIRAGLFLLIRCPSRHLPQSVKSLNVTQRTKSNQARSLDRLQKHLECGAVRALHGMSHQLGLHGVINMMEPRACRALAELQQVAMAAPASLSHCMLLLLTESVISCTCVPKC